MNTKPLLFMLFAHTTRITTTAQFHDVNANKLMTTELVEESQRLNAADLARSKGMDEAQAKEKKRLKKEMYDLAKFRGEKKTPDGRTIKENKNIEIRPLDPRFNPAFGNPFFRINSIEKKEEKIMVALSKKEREFFESIEDEELFLEEEEEEETKDDLLNGIEFNDVYDQFIISENKPRARCGLSREDAMNKCGQTCDPVVPTCLAPSSSADTNMLQIDGTWFFQGHCFEDVSCEGQYQEGEDAVLEGAPCSTKKVNNPCPNPCDCHIDLNKREKCHSKCSSLESRDILQCMKLRETGAKKREKKVLREILKQEGTPCEYNVHFVHPLLSFLLN